MIISGDTVTINGVTKPLAIAIEEYENKEKEKDISLYLKEKNYEIKKATRMHIRDRRNTFFDKHEKPGEVKIIIPSREDGRKMKSRKRTKIVDMAITVLNDTGTMQYEKLFRKLEEISKKEWGDKMKSYIIRRIQKDPRMVVAGGKNMDTRVVSVIKTTTPIQTIEPEPIPIVSEKNVSGTVSLRIKLRWDMVPKLMEKISELGVTPNIDMYVNME